MMLLIFFLKGVRTMNDENLTHTLTVSEQRAGGIASGKARRERKRLRQALEECLSLPCDIDGQEATNMEAVAAAVVRKAIGGDMRAVEIIRDTCEGKPTTNLSVETPAIAPEVYERVNRILNEDL